MDQPIESTEPTVAVCENCNAKNSLTQKFCSNCSFPIGGTDEERQKFRLNIGSHKLHIKRAHEKIKTGKIIIYVLAGIWFLFGLYQGFANDDFPTMIVNLLLSMLYLILASWADKNPFGAILTAFIIYITLQVVNLFIDPTTIFRGILLKIFFISALVKAIQSAREAQDSMAELDKLKGIVREN
jgi:hypothetical protein